MIIILLTDFGESSYVGQMKGIISKISSEINVIDLSHTIEKFNVLEAGFTLYNSIQYFPEDSIFVCVVDPGVGSNRKSIIIQTDKYIFIGPDNGLFTLILDKFTISKVIEISNFEFLNHYISSTFHGRDIFAPIAAKLAIGARIEEFGLEINPKTLISNNFFYAKFLENNIIGKVLFADSYGNLITNIHKSIIENKKFILEFETLRINKISQTFSDVKKGDILAYIGSNSHLELSINQGNLAQLISYDFDNDNLINIKITT